MSDEGINGNEKDNINIERCPHDTSNKFSIISNDLIRDVNLSPECRWLIIYLLSNKDNWKINVAQVINHLKPHMGKDKVYALFNEAIDAGYIKREQIKRNNKAGGKLKAYKYILSESPKFKKCFRYPENQDTGDQDPGFTDNKNNQDKENTSLKVPHGTHQAASPAAEPQPAKAGEVNSSSSKEKTLINQKAVLLVDRMIKSLQAIKPDFKVPKNLSQFLSQADFIIRLDGRDPQRVMDVFNWALSDPFWMDKMFKPNPAKYLREKFDQLEMKMKVIKPKPQLRQEDMPLDLSKIDPLILKRVREAKERGEYDN